MQVIRPDDHVGVSAKRGSKFTGDVFPYVTMAATDGVVINTVNFTPCARTYWHRHEGGQILFVVAGCGFVQSEGGEIAILREGDTVWTPAGERHWHGGSTDSYMTHVAISLGATTWEEEVDDDTYGATAGKN